MNKEVSDFVRHLNRTFGLKGFPKRYTISAKLYGLCCQEVFDAGRVTPLIEDKVFDTIVLVGSRRGLMFKGIELLIRKQGEKSEDK